MEVALIPKRPLTCLGLIPTLVIFHSPLPYIPALKAACVQRRWGYLQFSLFLQCNGIDDDELNADETEHEENRELVLKDQEELVMDIGSIWESLHKHIETLKHFGRCIVSMVPHDGFVQCMLYGQEAFFVVSYMRKQQISSIRDSERLKIQNN